MHWSLTRLLFSTLTFQVVLALTPSDGYNIGVVLGSIIGALLAIAIAGFIFYCFCIRRWLGVGEPPELGYARQNDYNLKKQVGRPTTFGFGSSNQGKAPPYSGGGGADQREGGRRQGAANDVYQYDEGRPQPHYPVGSAPRYEGPGGGEPVVLSGGGDRQRHSSQSPDNMSYSSESGGGGRPGFEATTTHSAYQARGYTAHTSGGAGGSPVSAAYLGTGV